MFYTLTTIKILDLYQRESNCMWFNCLVDGKQKIICFKDILQYYILCTKKPLFIAPQIISDSYDFSDLTDTLFEHSPYASFRELTDKVRYRGIVYILAVLLPDEKNHVVKVIDSYNNTFTALIDQQVYKRYDVYRLEPGRFYQCVIKRFGNKLDLYEVSDTLLEYHIDKNLALQNYIKLNSITQNNLIGKYDFLTSTFESGHKIILQIQNQSNYLQYDSNIQLYGILQKNYQQTTKIQNKPNQINFVSLQTYEAIKQMIDVQIQPFRVEQESQSISQQIPSNPVPNSIISVYTQLPVMYINLKRKHLRMKLPIFYEDQFITIYRWKLNSRDYLLNSQLFYNIIELVITSVQPYQFSSDNNNQDLYKFYQYVAKLKQNEDIYRKLVLKQTFHLTLTLDRICDAVIIKHLSL